MYGMILPFLRQGRQMLPQIILRWNEKVFLLKGGYVVSVIMICNLASLSCCDLYFILAGNP